MSLDMIPESVTFYISPSVIINRSTHNSSVFHVIYLFIAIYLFISIYSLRN